MLYFNGESLTRTDISEIQDRNKIPISFFIEFTYIDNNVSLLCTWKKLPYKSGIYGAISSVCLPLAFVMMKILLSYLVIKRLLPSDYEHQQFASIPKATRTKHTHTQMHTVLFYFTNEIFNNVINFS